MRNVEVLGVEEVTGVVDDAATQYQHRMAQAFKNTILAHQARTALWRRRALALLVLSIWLGAALVLVLFSR
jgi:hypothetical protein